MREVYLINPTKRKKRKSAAKKRRVSKKTTSRTKRATTKKTTRRVATKAAARKTTGVKSMAKRKTKKRRSYKKNPAPRRYSAPRRKTSTARRAARSVRSTFAGLNIKSALKNVPYAQIGMFGSKWLAKKFGGGAMETDPESWTWRSYLQGALGAAGAAYIMQMVKPGTGQRVLEGGLNLMLYEIIQNELISGSEWASGQFGAENEDLYSYEPGDVEQDETGKSYLLGQDYEWRELPEAGVEGVLEPVGPLGQLEPVGPLGSTDLYRKALLDA